MHRSELDWHSSNRDFRLIAGRRISPENIVSTQNVTEYLDDWIVDAEYNRLSKQTIDSKRNALSQFIWWLQQQAIEEIRPATIKSFIAYLHNAHLSLEGRWATGRRAPLSERAVEIYFVNIRAYFNWMMTENIIADNPAAEISVPKPRKPEIKPFTPEQVLSLLNACRKTDHPQRNTAIISLLIDTGMRVSELCGLRFRDITMQTSVRGVICVRSGKGGKDRTVPFERAAAKALWQHMKQSAIAPEGHLFIGKGGGAGAGRPLTRSGVQSLFRTLERLSGITGVRCSPHTCRHTFAIEYLRNQGNIETLRLVLGHEKLEMVLTYARLAEADIINRHRVSSPLNNLLDG